jgi:predicted ArsR family transcriptional regulator
MIELVRQVANMVEAKQVEVLLERKGTKIIQQYRPTEIFSNGNDARTMRLRFRLNMTCFYYLNKHIKKHKVSICKRLMREFIRQTKSIYHSNLF